jgi:hybrid cluster-associated redox disulfide protein
MITEDMTIEEVFRRYPGANDVFLRHGLDCVGCQIAEYESIGHAARVYGINLEALLNDLNKLEEAV